MNAPNHPPRKRSALSGAEVQIAIEQIRLGQPLCHVAAEMNVHRHTLSRFIARMGRSVAIVKQKETQTLPPSPVKTAGKAQTAAVIKPSCEISVISGEALKEAVHQVKLGRPIMHVAREMCVSRSTLSKYLQRLRSGCGADYIVRKSAVQSNRFFSTPEERTLEEYVHTCHLLFHLITTDSVRSLAYQFAIKLGKTIPDCWQRHRLGGKDWFSGYMVRHPAIHTSDASMARSRNFQRKYVATFFDTWSLSVEMMGFGAESVYCLDEIELRLNGLGRCTAKSLKCSQYYTTAFAAADALLCVCANAAGTVLPPAVVFPNNSTAPLPPSPNYHLLVSASSSVSDVDVFAAVLRHFVSAIGCSRENPIALIISDKTAHISLAVIDIARDLGVSLLATPPRSSHWLMPLARGVLEVFGEECKRQTECGREGSGEEYSEQREGSGEECSLQRECGRETGSEYLVKAFTTAFTSDRIRRGFELAGVWPLNRAVVDEQDWFGPEEMEKTPGVKAVNYSGSEFCRKGVDADLDDSGIGRDRDRDRMRFSASPRKRGSLTSSVEEWDGSDAEEEGSGDELGDILELSCRDPVIDDFVLIRFAAVNSNRQLHYVGRVIDKITTTTTTGEPSTAIEAASSSSSEETFFDVEFYRQCSRAPGRFSKPQVNDTSRIVRSDIVTCLPEPIRHRGATKRVSALLQFKYDLTKYNCQ